jgi:alpha-L-rhamnosidase
MSINEVPGSAMSVRPARLTTDARITPLGIDSTQPEFAWKIETEFSSVLQTAWSIEVADGNDVSDSLVWASGRVEGSRPFGARYAGRPLASMSRYSWRVRVWYSIAGGQEESAWWSEPSWFETGILTPALWQASWIGGELPTSKDDDAVLYLRGEIDVAASIVRARAYVSALGWYRLFINGADQTGSALVPRWTPYSEVIEYQSYDVTEAVASGRNVIAIAVGDGRYRGGLGLTGTRNSYGVQTGAFAQLHLELADGSSVIAATDESWHAGPGRITGADPKNGERVDLRIPDIDWLTDAIAPARFAPAVVLEHQHRTLIAEELGRVTAVERRRAVVTRAASGAQLLDFGQNIAGVTRIRLRGATGTTVSLTHSELLTPEGELDTQYIQLGKEWFQRDTVILNGLDEWYEPWFTIHGFRYVEVVGLEKDIDPADVEGLVLSSAVPTTGWFECSDPRLEKLHENVAWSLRGNFTDTPTDCPTRERAGWTGDIQVFAPTAATMVDVQAFLRRYLRNLALEQFDDGAVPLFIPSGSPVAASVGRSMIHFMSRSVGWSDAAVLLPWTLYQYYGDAAVLQTQYSSAQRWVEGMARAARRTGRGRPLSTLRTTRGRRAERYILDSGFHFGEWLRPGEVAPRLIGRNVLRPPAVVATAYLAHSSAVLADTASVLGLSEDARRYRTLSDRVRSAWRIAFVRPDGRIGADRQDDYVRALSFDLLLPEQREAALDRLVALIEQAGDHLDTGFLSTPMLLSVLTDGGRLDVALRLLFQTTNPSWLYQIDRGATTVWETWEGYDEKGHGKESHNHYALGAVARWLTETLSGISPAEPGYARIRIDPDVPDRLAFAGATLETPYGRASSRWRRDEEELLLEVIVPPGSTAEVHLPSGEIGAPILVGSGRHEFRWRPKS